MQPYYADVSQSMRGFFLAFILFPMTPGASEKDKVAQIDALFAGYTGDVPGAGVIVLGDGKVLLKKSYGMANLEEKRSVTAKTNFRLASLTKQFTATCILILADRGRLSLDDPLTKFFPDLPAFGRDIKVRHLLNHTSGLPAYEDLMPEGAQPIVDADVLAILKRAGKPYFSPGSQFRYSNSGYALLALVVEKVSGRSFSDFLKQNIFRPLGMRATHLNVAAQRDESRRAYGYSRRGQNWERTDQSRTSYVLGDGGIYSSVDDLRRWDAALYTARLIRAATLEQAMSPTVSAGPLGEDRRATASEEEIGYGFGWFVAKYRGLPVVWHGGSSLGFRTHILRIPEKRFTVVILTNRNEGDVAALARKVADFYLFRAR